jgi:transposase InsO family protein
VDSAADLNSIKESIILQHKGSQVGPSDQQVKGISGISVSQGQLGALVEAGDHFGQWRRVLTNFEVLAEQPYDIILGLPWGREADPNLDWVTGKWVYRLRKKDLCLITTKREYRRVAKESAVAVALMLSNIVLPSEPPVTPRVSPMPPELEEFRDLGDIDKAGLLPEHHYLEHAIDLEEGEMPPFGPIYPLNEKEQQALQEYIANAVARGWIRYSSSPAGAPILFVPKPGGKLRLCVDYRGLNRLTRKDRTPLPLISEILDRLTNSKVYTKIDLKDAYHRLRIREGDEWKTAFRTKYGHFEYLVMPFGLTNAPATFQRYINHALAGLVDNICIVYLDDIVIYSKDRDQHLQAVRSVLTRLQEWSLYINLDKCDWFTDRILFLGFVVTPTGISMDRSKVQAIEEWPVPHSVHEIQVFLGFTGFYRRFIRGYAQVTTPLTERLKGKQPPSFDLTPEERMAFLKLQILFTRAPILRHFDPTLPIRIETDASNFALGATISQHYEGRWHPIAYFSRKLRGAELRYHTPDAELLAIYCAFVQWRHYLYYAQHQILVLTDHLNHSYLTTKPQLSTKQASWLQRLMEFDFKIEYRPGRQNPADALSRRPDHFDPAAKQEARKDLIPQFLEKFSDRAKLEEKGHKEQLLRPRPSNCEQAGGLEGVRSPPCDSTFKDFAPVSSNACLTTGEPEGGCQAGDSGLSAFTFPPSRSAGAREGGLGDHAAISLAGIAGGPLRPPSTAPEALDKSLKDTIREAQQADEFVTSGSWKQRRARGSTAGPIWLVSSDGLLRYRGRVYIPTGNRLARELLRSCHDAPLSGHQGVTKTIKRLAISYFWNSLAKDVREYVATCAICQRTKARTHRPYGELASLPVPTTPFQEISCDFITGLPLSTTWWGKQCDCVLVVVDRLSKYALYIPTVTTLTAGGLADLLFTQVFTRFGLPEGIVSDRGSLFTSHFWATLCHRLVVSRKLSTAFHPQTDGQTERQNQSLEHYLRTYGCFEQDDWAEKLVLAEWVYNTSVHSAHGKTPAEVLFGYMPRGPFDQPTKAPKYDTQSARERVAWIQQSHKDITQLLEHSNQAYAKWYNKKRQPHLFKVGGMVMLSTKNINQQRPSPKLADKYLGPFEILEVVGNNSMAYKLKLPSTYRMHNTFPISALEPYKHRPGDSLPPPQEPMATQGEDIYTVEKILAHRGPLRKREYLVRWQGYTSEDDSWVAKTDIGTGIRKEYEDELKATRAKS